MTRRSCVRSGNLSTHHAATPPARSCVLRTALSMSCLAAVLCSTSAASAQTRAPIDPGPEIEAGTAEFRARHYPEAITLFRAAYIESHQAFLLYNIAVAYDRSGDAVHAIESYRQFLATLGPSDATQRTTVEQAIARLEASIPTTPSSAPTSPVSATPSPVRHEEHPSGVSPLLFAGAALAVAAAAGAVVVWAVSDSLAHSYTQRCVAPAGALPASCAMDFATTQSDLNTRGVVIDVLWVAAGIGAVGATVGAILTARNRTSSHEAAVQAVVAPNYAGVLWRF